MDEALENARSEKLGRLGAGGECDRLHAEMDSLRAQLTARDEEIARLREAATPALSLMEAFLPDAEETDNLRAPSPELVERVRNRFEQLDENFHTFCMDYNGKIDHDEELCRCGDLDLLRDVLKEWEE